jgi:hypothetical protein
MIEHRPGAEESAEVVRASHTPTDRVLLINLSPAVLLQPALYALFKNTCVEFPCAWHAPAGPAVLPLETAIHVAACVHKWLQLDADHVVCLHARAPAAAHPASLLRFVTACYLTYWCVGPVASQYHMLHTAVRAYTVGHTSRAARLPHTRD